MAQVGKPSQCSLASSTRKKQRRLQQTLAISQMASCALPDRTTFPTLPCLWVAESSGHAVSQVPGPFRPMLPHIGHSWKRCDLPREYFEKQGLSLAGRIRVQVKPISAKSIPTISKSKSAHSTSQIKENLKSDVCRQRARVHLRLLKSCSESLMVQNQKGQRHIQLELNSGQGLHSEGIISEGNQVLFILLSQGKNHWLPSARLCITILDASPREY